MTYPSPASQDGTGSVVVPTVASPCPPPHPLPTASPCPELVRYATLNSEHFLQPTQQIRNIVRQYQQPLQGGRPKALRSALPPCPPALQPSGQVASSLSLSAHRQHAQLLVNSCQTTFMACVCSCSRSRSAPRAAGCSGCHFLGCAV